MIFRISNWYFLGWNSKNSSFQLGVIQLLILTACIKVWVVTGCARWSNFLGAILASKLMLNWYLIIIPSPKTVPSPLLGTFPSEFLRRFFFVFGGEILDFPVPWRRFFFLISPPKKNGWFLTLGLGILPKTNRQTPLRDMTPKKKEAGSSSNFHPFFRCKIAVSFREGIEHHDFPCFFFFRFLFLEVGVD